jgi:D-galactarolactone cycloisomerase
MKIRTVEVVSLVGDRSLGQDQPIHAIVRIGTDAGLIGVSRAYAGTRKIIEDDLAPLLVGESPLNVERLWAAMYQLAGQRGAPLRSVLSALGAVDIGLWDLAGKIHRCPVHRLLGGYRDTIAAYADGGMFGRGPTGHAAWSERAVERGFRAVKYHVMGEGPDQIVETARQIRAAVGPGVQVMVDVHKQWAPWPAVDTARQLEQHDVFWLEEPILADDEVHGMAILAANSRIAVAAGESECTLFACRDLVARAGIRVLQTDILSAGGYTAWRKMAALAQAFHVSVAPHGASFPELAAPLVAAVPNGLTVSAFPAGEPIELWSRLYREPLDLRSGTIFLRDQPVLGLELDEDYLAAHRL